MAKAQDRRSTDFNHVIGTNIVRSARDFSLDFVFPSLTRIFEKKTIFGDKLKHVIEPRATYRYVTGIGNGLQSLHPLRRDATCSPTPTSSSSR